jgi:YegS/Rv2252/BmrU family lipid kinase
MAESRHIIFLINPVSGTANKGFLKKLIQEKCDRVNVSFECMDTRADGDYSALAGRIDSGEVTDVVICGGDGSVNKVAASIGGMKVTLGIIPLGSGNGLALAAHIPLKPQAAIDLILQAKKQEAVDGFLINEKFSCMLAGIGFDAAVAHAFAKEKKRGLATYIRKTISEFFHSKPYPFVIETADRKMECEAFFISVANSNQFGNHVTIAPKASLNDGLLDVIVVRKSGKIKMLLSLLWQIRAGKVLSADSRETKNPVQYFHTDHLKIINRGMAPLHIDGDPEVTAGEFDIKVIPSAFKLWMGR